LFKKSPKILSADHEMIRVIRDASQAQIC